MNRLWESAISCFSQYCPRNKISLNRLEIVMIAMCVCFNKKSVEQCGCHLIVTYVF